MGPLKKPPARVDIMMKCSKDKYIVQDMAVFVREGRKGKVTYNTDWLVERVQSRLDIFHEDRQEA